MSAPANGARVSGTQEPEDAATGTDVGKDCGLNVDDALCVAEFG